MPKATNLVPSFACPLMLFVTGVLFAAVAFGTTYLGQACYHHNYSKCGNAIRILTVSLVVVSYSAFVGGGYHAYKIIRAVQP